MNFHVQHDKNQIVFEDNTTIPLYSKEGFKLISDLWLKMSWDQKHAYSFTWLGRPVIQIPEDIIRAQEVIYSVKPDVIIETGIAHGGALIFYATVCQAMGKGRVVGVDIDIRPNNRKAMETHELSNLITLIEGDSTSLKTVEMVKKQVSEKETVLVILDSGHDYNHVWKELEAYSPLVSAGSYIVATDGVQEFFHDIPRAKKDYPNYVETWPTNNPKKAAEDFATQNPDFIIEEPEFLFNEGNVDFRITYWPSAYIKRLR
ncbi:MAG: class I SAM-dependent methyltransferase [Fibrobacteria bacterium]|nr:class I SAM-dependent methyltransferase [Fibrobacteria bacterium]